MNKENLSFTTTEEEIAFLREQISLKESELLEKKEKYEIDNVIKDQIEKYKNNLKNETIDQIESISKVDVESIILNLEPEKHDKRMEELLGILNKDGLSMVFSVLGKLNDPHLEDDFHRFLVQYIKHGYEVKGFNRSKNNMRGFGMTLYEVVLSEDLSTDKEKQKTLKEIISSMEQFLSGMLSIVDNDGTKNYANNYLVLEIAKSNNSDQIVFYVAIPDNHKNLFEKHIISIFDDIRLTEVNSDYNIFYEDGISLGSYMEPSINSIYPIKTYESFDYDPLNIILNSFSKIDKNSESACIQIVFSPKGDYFQKKYEYAVSQIENGVPTKEAIDIKNSFGGEIKKVILSLFKGNPKSDEKKPVDSEAIQKIKQKMNSTIVATNVRLLASAKNRNEAERILREIESSFNQFTETQSNGVKFKRIEKNKLKKFFRNYSFRSYNPDELFPLNLKEITSFIHFQNTALVRTPQLKQTQSATAPIPSEMISQGIMLGTNLYRNVENPVYIQDEDRLRHIYTIGQTGTGKTTLLKNMIIQDIEKGNGVCFIDPHGTDVQSILANIPKERFQDVIYFDPSYIERPMALNMLEYDRNHPEQKTFVVNELFSIFQKLYMKGNPEALGPMFEQYFRNSTMLVIEDPDSGCTLLDVSRVMTNKNFRDMKLANCKNPVVVQFWKEVAEKAGGEASLANIVPYITSKFDVFLANDIMRPIIAQEKSSFDFRDIMDNKKILLVNLSKGKLGDINSSLIGLILVGKILMSALSRVDSLDKNLPPFYLYIDEFQNITTNSISTILSEARKYKLSLHIAHQFIAQLDEDIRNAVFGNVGSIFAYRVGAEDAEFLEKQFSPIFTAKDIMNIDNYNFYAKMLVSGKPTKAFNVKASIPPKGDYSILEPLKQLSFLTYGGDRVEIENKITSKYSK